MYPKDIKKNILSIINQYENKKVFDLNIKYKNFIIVDAINMFDGLIIGTKDINNIKIGTVYQYFESIEPIGKYLIYKKLLKINIYNNMRRIYPGYETEEISNISNKIYNQTLYSRKKYKKSKK